MQMVSIVSIAVTSHFCERLPTFGKQSDYIENIIMKKIKITVMKKVCHKDLIERYENPLENPCDMEEGQIFIANGWQRPENFCESAWESMSAFVLGLSHGAENFYNGCLKNKKSVMISCNDGFRPVSFLVETLDEDAENF